MLVRLSQPIMRRSRLAALVALLVAVVACQGMDRLEPDRAGDETGAGDRGTILDPASNPGLGGGRLTEEIAGRWVRQMEAADGAERLQIAEQFLQEHPDGSFIGYVHELVGDAYSATDQPAAAAAAYERAIRMSWPAPDLLELPLTNVELPYQVGWARFQAGNAEIGSDWLVRATFVSDLPQLEQGLRFLYSELGSPAAAFDDWLAMQRRELAVAAPDFELPGFQQESVRLSDLGGRLTLINFWTPT